MSKTLALALASLVVAGAAQAAPWRFDYGGVLGASDAFGPAGARAALPAGTPFSFSAIFDDALDLTAPTGLPGWAAYAPTGATMTLLGRTYGVVGNAGDADDGVVVMLFDPTNVFNPGFWAAGIHGAPLTSDTGIIARFRETDSDARLDDGLDATTYGGYVGAGYVSGPPDTPGPGFRCWPQIGAAECADQPFLLFDDEGGRYELSIASRSQDGPVGARGFTASLTPVPLPATLPLLASLLALPAVVRGLRRIRRR